MHVEFPVPGRTWVSDVYAVRDGRKVVFEVQIGTISPSSGKSGTGDTGTKGLKLYWLLDNFLDD